MSNEHMNEANAGLVERARQQAKAASQASKMLADAKTARQSDPWSNYAWLEPEQTLEWQLADHITAQAARIVELEAEMARKDAALEWYGEQAEAAARSKNGIAMHAILVALALDAGNRALAALQREGDGK